MKHHNRENVYFFADNEIWTKFSGGDLHYHLSQHGVFSEDDVSSMESLFIIEIPSLKK